MLKLDKISSYRTDNQMVANKKSSNNKLMHNDYFENILLDDQKSEEGESEEIKESKNVISKSKFFINTNKNSEKVSNNDSFSSSSSVEFNNPKY
jgi:hypothetical protein